jgi:hypothetical protein
VNEVDKNVASTTSIQIQSSSLLDVGNVHLKFSNTLLNVDVS